MKRWFGPYIVMHVLDNATYKLSELDGTELIVPIAGKRVKLFKKRCVKIIIDDTILETLNVSENTFVTKIVTLS